MASIKAAECQRGGEGRKMEDRVKAGAAAGWAPHRLHGERRSEQFNRRKGYASREHATHTTHMRECTHTLPEPILQERQKKQEALFSD